MTSTSLNYTSAQNGSDATHLTPEFTDATLTFLDDCTKLLKIWFVVYLAIITVKFLFSLQKFCIVLRAYPEDSRRHIDHAGLKAVEKKVENLNSFEYKYVNPVLLVHLVIGNIIYFRQEPRMMN